MGRYNRPFYAYYTYYDMANSDILRPDGAVNLNPKGGMPPEMLSGARRGIIVRPSAGSDGSVKLSVAGGGGVMGLSASDIQPLIGSVIGESNGIPIILGAPAPAGKGMNRRMILTVKDPTTQSKLYGIAMSKGKGSMLASTPGPPVIMLEGIEWIILAIIIATTIIATAALLTWGSTSDERKIETESKLREKALEAAAESSEIQSEYDDAMGNHYIVYHDGTIVRIGADGTYSVDTSGSSNVEKVAEDAINEPYTLGGWGDIVTWILIGVGGLAALYIVVVYVAPGLMPKKEVAAAPAPAPAK
jgi:hypothetical protein